MPEKKNVKPVKKTVKSAKPSPEHIKMNKSIDEVRNSTISLYNVMAKKGLITEKEFMTEYNKVSASKKK